MKRLPPVFALRALEAATRHQSYSRAADELAVTHGAVSQQIRRLEAELSAKLFERCGNAMLPSLDARRLAHEVRKAFDLLQDAVTEFGAAGKRSPLVLSIDAQFAGRWLPKRLPRLLASPAGANLELRVDDRCADLVTDGVDMGVRYGAGRWVGLEAQLLFRESLFPVCSPQVAARLELRRPADLRAAPLLHHAHRPWDLWFGAHGLPAPAPTGLLFDDSLMLCEAAAQGQGVALGRDIIVEPDLATGRLMAPLGGAVPSDLGFFLVWRADSRKLPRILALCDWFRAEAVAVANACCVAA
jgi:LysR family glycine cleavage system transcriptional activator